MQCLLLPEAYRDFNTVDFSASRFSHSFDLPIAHTDLSPDHFKNDAPIASRYYLMMSHYYLEFPEKAEEVLQHSLHLWNTLHMPLIFALLFHEYVRKFAPLPTIKGDALTLTWDFLTPRLLPLY